MQYLLILALVIAIFSVVFALQNAMAITVSFLMWEIESSLALVLLVTLGVGIIVGLLGMAPNLIKKSLKISNQNKKIKQLQATIAEKETAVELTKRIEPDATLPAETGESRLRDEESV